MKEGTWAACVPLGGQNPRFRHWFNVEGPLWGAAATTSICGAEFSPFASWFIGSTSEKMTTGACPDCLEILKRKEAP
jgi:hypothetical protein